MIVIVSSHRAYASIKRFNTATVLYISIGIITTDGINGIHSQEQVSPLYCLYWYERIKLVSSGRLAIPMLIDA
jgi:hypothetical protein